MELTPAHARSILATIGVEADGLEPIPSRGVGHDHFRLLGRGMVLRVPVWSRIGSDAEARLAYQAAAFTRAHPSGHTPRLIKVIPPDNRLPTGALLVEEAVGRPPRDAGDFAAIAEALAALHRRAIPEPDALAPLEYAPDPVAHLLALVEGRADIFARGDLAAESVAILTAQLAAARAEVTALPPDTPRPIRLIGTDVHPGNFIIGDDGRAVFVDLERVQYGHPAMDLAHATLPTSTRWDPAVATTLTPERTAAFVETWRAAVGETLAAQVAPAARVLRRLVWLRTLTWMAAWRRRDENSAKPMAPSLALHLRRHADEVLSPPALREVSREWA